MPTYQYPPHGVFRPLAPVEAVEYRRVQVRVLRPFFANGRRVEVDEIVLLPEPDADDACALGRAQRV